MKRMLIDAAHAEDVRVAILDGSRLEDFDSETQGKQQLKGNIYIGHVSRVEPSLQAAFITYGGNRNGFLAFGEVHPQFFNIDKKEKATLLEELAEQAARRRGLELEEDEAIEAALTTATPEAPAAETETTDAEAKPTRGRKPGRGGRGPKKEAAAAEELPVDNSGDNTSDKSVDKAGDKPEKKASKAKPARASKKAEGEKAPKRPARLAKKAEADEADNADTGGIPKSIAAAMPRPRRVSGTDITGTDSAPAALLADGSLVEHAAGDVNGNTDSPRGGRDNRGRGGRGGNGRGDSRGDRPQRAERGTGSDDSENKRQAGIHRRYRIQDVLKEGQKILVQVVKEERGSKGAALTTYFSLPGRFTVLMPNTPHAGGISRKITDHEERKALREAYAGLKISGDMGLIIRTAGVGQPSAAIQKDYANLSNLWSGINDAFEKEQDIQCLHEDGSLIVRAMRDMNSEDIEEILISGKRACKMAKDYARNMMPDSTKLIKEYTEETPLFAAYKVEEKLHQLYHNRVPLPSGGSMVINPTEALVAVDINSGRATQERNIEETALKTNLEACEELGRQIRLRDLAGLIVVDFIDMEDTRNVRKVENAIRKVLRKDRARVQFGRISEFGLLEISRQRMRPSFGESHLVTCPHCQGSGLIHGLATSALMILRRLEEEDVRGSDRIFVSTSADLIVWLMNNKRDAIRDLEAKYKYHLLFRADDSIIAPDHKLELVNVKSDGTESSRIIEVMLREQPELPPELRKHGRGDRRPRPEDENADKSREKTEKSDRPERESRDAAPRKEREDRPQRADRPERAERPERTERPARDDKRERKAEVKPVIADTPKKESKPAVDAPLEVQQQGDTGSAKAAPVKANIRKLVVKAEADTDADDAPLQVATQSADSKGKPAKASPKKADVKTEAEDAAPVAETTADKKPGSILSRLLTRG